MDGDGTVTGSRLVPVRSDDYKSGLSEGRRQFAADVVESIGKFARIMRGSVGRIPTEKLSFHDWHKLTKLVPSYFECPDCKGKIYE